MHKREFVIEGEEGAKRATSFKPRAGAEGSCERHGGEEAKPTSREADDERDADRQSVRRRRSPRRFAKQNDEGVP